jgi:hypothetical protein
MVPPLPLGTGGVGPKVEVATPLLCRSIGSRARNHLSAEAELVDAAITAVGAVQEKGHQKLARLCQEVQENSLLDPGSRRVEILIAD